MIELFENQQQTVPQSLTQLQSTIISKPPTPKSATQSISADSAKSGKVSPYEKEDIQRGDEVEHKNPEIHTTFQNLAYSTNISEGRVSDIVSRFQGEKARSWEAEEPDRQRTANGSRPSRGRRRLSSTSVAEEEDDSPVEDAQNDADVAPPAKVVGGADPPPTDFNWRPAECLPIVTNSPPSPPSSKASTEPEIPSINQSPAKPLPGVVPNAFDHMRPLRTPLQEATIIVDDKVFTSIIGSQPVQQQSKFTVAAPRSKATPKRVPPVNHSFSQALSTFRANNTKENSSSRLVRDISGGDQEHGEEPADNNGAKLEISIDEDEERDAPQHTADYAEPMSCNSRSALLETEDDEPEMDPRRTQLEEEASSAPIDDDSYDATASEAATFDEQEDTEASDEEYLDEATKKAREDANVAHLIREAEEKAARPTEDDSKRAQNILKGINRKYSTFNLSQLLAISVGDVDRQMRTIEQLLETSQVTRTSNEDSLSQIEPNTTAEDRLSLIISKVDFEHMRVIGQFNLGFIIAFRPSSYSPTDEDVGQAFHPTSSELFIIDQHASDEKSNFESLQLSTTVQAQPLVNAFPLSLTAIEEEIIIENQESFAKNGFIINIDETGDSPVGQRCRLLALPMSKELTFDLRDLEELIALLAESSNTSQYSPIEAQDDDGASTTPRGNKVASAKTIARPTKVRKMFAMRACRSSIMVGKSLSHKDMRKVIRRMGEMDKPWNCPHGRPTMRHLVGLDRWESWAEGDGLLSGGNEGEYVDARETEEDIDWGAWIRR